MKKIKNNIVFSILMILLSIVFIGVFIYIGYDNKISFFYGICVFITSVIFLIIGVYTYKGSAEHYFESKSKQKQN